MKYLVRMLAAAPLCLLAGLVVGAWFRSWSIGLIAAGYLLAIVAESANE